MPLSENRIRLAAYYGAAETILFAEVEVQQRRAAEELLRPRRG